MFILHASRLQSTLLILTLAWSCPQSITAEMQTWGRHILPEIQENAEAEALRLRQQAIEAYNKGQYDEAISIEERTLAIVEKALGVNNVQVAISLNIIAESYWRKAEYNRAEPLYLRALAIVESTFGPDHPDVAFVLNNLGKLYQAKGDYTRAEEAFERAQAIVDKAPERSQLPNVIGLLINRAKLYLSKDDYGRAESLYLRAQAMLEKAPGNDYLVAYTMHGLASVYLAQGQHARAIPLYQRAVEMLKRLRGEEDVDVASFLSDLGGVYYFMGDYENAEQVFLRSLKVFERTFGENHPSTATLLNNLGELYTATYAYERAEPLYRRALTTMQRMFGDEHASVAALQANLGGLYVETGEFARAEPLLLRSLQTHEKKFGERSLEAAGSQMSLALLYHRKGEYGRAETAYARALEIFEIVRGRNHPTIAKTLVSLGALYQAKGETAKAVSLFARASDISEDYLTNILFIGSETQKRLYLDALWGEATAAVALHAQFAPHNPEAAHLALTTILRRKGRVLDAMAAQIRGLRRRLTSQNRALLDEWSAAHGKLATLVFDEKGGLDPSQNRAMVDKLKAEVERLETVIGSSSLEFREQAQPISLERVRQNIPADTALIEIAAYKQVDVKAKTPDAQYGVERYVAYVLRRQGELKFVDLGESALIDRKVAELRAALSNQRRSDVRQIARAMDATLMQPIRNVLGNITKVLLSPDGSLNLVPFGALVDERNEYLVNRYSITYLTSGRDLLRLQTNGPSNQQPVVIANPAFDLTRGGIVSNAKAPHATNENRRSRDFKERFEPLEGTAEEGTEIGSLLKVKPIMAEKATESAIKQLSSPKILHVATHGFFLSDMPKPKVGRQAAKAQGNFPYPPTNETPLLRSGLALAGANRLQGGNNEDGILTALEASGLDLWGTKLVVLSACDTGIGDVQNGEGVYGLRRALVLAGAESQVMTLWKVDDEVTRDLMVAYYRRLLVGEGRAESLRQVQLEMLKNEAQSHPYFWASFINSGDWQPLNVK